MKVANKPENEND